MLSIPIALQFIVTLLTAPLIIGLIRNIKAKFQNRKGASVFLPYISLLSLLKKEMTITRHSSWVFRVVPFVVLISAMALALIVPTLSYGFVPSSLSNIFLVGGIAALGSVFLVFGGMDTASTFGNMGSSREMTLAALVEPVFFIVLSTLAALAGTWGLDAIVGYFASTPWVQIVPIASLTLFALLLVLLTENARYPVDNPATHLELTMVHEAMILEYSGPYLAMLEYASAIKLAVMGVLFMNLLIPFGLITLPFTLQGVAIGLLVYLGKVLLAACLVATIESTIVKMRFYRMQEFLSLAFVIAFGGLVLVLITRMFA